MPEKTLRRSRIHFPGYLPRERVPEQMRVHVSTDPGTLRHPPPPS
jgi:hypothetical protein